MEKIENAKIEDLRKGDVVDLHGLVVDYTDEDNDIFLEDGGWIGKESFKSITIHRQSKEEKEFEELKAMAEKLGYSLMPKYQELQDSHNLKAMVAAQRLKYSKEGYRLKDEGWTLWSGGECPVEDGVLIEIKFKDGESAKSYLAKEWRWENVIAYRVVEGE